MKVIERAGQKQPHGSAFFVLQQMSRASSNWIIGTPWGQENQQCRWSILRELEFFCMNNSYGNSVFRSFEFPVFEAGNRPDNDTDTDPRGRHGRHKMWTAETPTLRHIISSGHELHQATSRHAWRMSCSSVRPIGKRTIFLLQITETGWSTFGLSGRYPQWKKFGLILGLGRQTMIIASSTSLSQLIT